MNTQSLRFRLLSWYTVWLAAVFLATGAVIYFALANYLEVFNGVGPERDPFWTQKAGLQAAELASALGEWQEVTNLYASLARQFPQLKTELATKAALAAQNLSPPGR